MTTEQPSVFVVRDGLLEMRTITLRDDVGDDLIEVGSGLIGGERVVLDPDQTLRAGDRIQVKRSP
ncbi:MAG: hypothetical protein HRU16_07840 [Planctomycetes bacterium]|nr:hypothetical protein [Planctomycetota bacterium]